MNTNNIKKYAPKARSAFIAAMTKRAALFGIRESSIPAMGIEQLEQKGDLALIGDRAFPASIIRPRAALVKKVEQLGFAQAIEQAAYSWFNRLCAIRFMELKGYLDHGLRVLSHPSQPGGFQILDDCLNIDLPGLDKQRITELKLDGNQDEALYRELLLAQCHALHQAMPFLFEAIDDQTELLLPDNLTKTDSLLRELVDAIPEEDWQDVEIIGWLYQFYISEKKDQVIGKVVKSEDIPAATQLFTPNWIVKYMVQNSLGAQWLATYPDSPLKAQMEYYIEPAEQTDEVNAHLATITPSALNPEELTLIDPACGSGHILVEGYELFKAIYLERGYRQRDLPQLILEKNLFGLDIDGRAAQLTGFALMMKGRADDRRLFERGVKLNVMALVDSAGFDAEVLAGGLALSDYGLQLGDFTELKRLFEHATTFGSLIQVPEGLAKRLPGLKKLSEATSQDLFVADELKRLVPLVQQAELLAAQYDAVVANPPYMGGKGMNNILKTFIADKFPHSTANFFAAFVERFSVLSKSSGYIGAMTPYAWMFLKSYEMFRRNILDSSSLQSLIEPEYHAFFDSAYVSVCTFVLRNQHTSGLISNFIKLSEFYGSDEQPRKALEAIKDPNCGWFYTAETDKFKDIWGSPIAYWASRKLLSVFAKGDRIGEVIDAAVGLQTGDNDHFLRRWPEVSISEFSYKCVDRNSAQESLRTWFPYNKGGMFRRWHGHYEYVVNYKDDGRELQEFRPRSVIRSPKNYFKPSVSWSDITSGPPSFRLIPYGFIHDVKGMSAFHETEETLKIVAAYCNTPIVTRAAAVLNPSVNFQVGNFVGLPYLSNIEGTLAQSINALVSKLLGLSTDDWDAYERSWVFQSLPILTALPEPTLESSYTAWITQNRATIAEMKRLEEENNRLFIDAYGLADELTADVPIEQITLTVNPAYRYGGKMSEAELWTRFREDSMQELVSYAIGCMMGRYSLDEPGLIYAHSGNEGFDPSRYTTFPADDDGIVPLTDKEWFADDAANRLVEFIGVAWDKTHLEANLRFLADNLSPKKGEGSRDTLRRYLCDSFFKDHLQTYKKRPIYWLFSSGKQKAFQCLVYLHRYNASTLSRMRTLHVIPLSAKLNSYANKLEQDIDASTSTAEKKALEKQLATLHNQQAELATFDEKLRHHADLRITLDLDDGVKVNYAKFGDLLAEVKAVTGDK
jgi:type II restriction/modification system DNA methylase subunit YeeA